MTTTSSTRMSDTGCLSPEEADHKLLAQIVDFYNQSLKSTTVSLDYLRKRGVTNGDAIDHFRIGFSDRTLGPTLPSKQLKAGRNIRSRLERLGIYRSSGHEHLNGCVVFPITAADGTGRIVDIYGRKIGGKRLRKGTAQHLHLNDQRQGVWNIEAFGATDELIVCPSLFDALVFWNHGYRNVTCVFGIEADALTEDFMNACAEFRIRRIMTPCDSLSNKLIKAGMDCSLLRLPPGLDVNDYALQVDDAAECLGAVIRKAEWIGNGRKSHAKANVEASEPKPQESLLGSAYADPSPSSEDGEHATREDSAGHVSQLHGI